MNEAKNLMLDYRLKHIRLVQDNMLLLEKNLHKLPFKIKDFELMRRGMHHDLDKFSDKLANGYMEIESNYQNRKKDPELFNQNEEKLKPIRMLHWENNPHHALCHEKNCTEMSNLDACEFCSDLDAVSEIMGDSPKEHYMNEEYKRYPEIFKKQHENILKIFDLLKELKK